MACIQSGDSHMDWDISQPCGNPYKVGYFRYDEFMEQYKNAYFQCGLKALDDILALEKEMRYEILAGFIDYNAFKTADTVEIRFSQYQKYLVECTVFLANSLGLDASYEYIKTSERCLDAVIASGCEVGRSYPSAYYNVYIKGWVYTGMEAK